MPYSDGFPALAGLSGLGWVASIGPGPAAARFLSNQPTNALADLNTAVRTRILAAGDALAVQLPGFEAGDQLLNFFFLGEADGGAMFFWRLRCSGGFPGRPGPQASSVSCRHWA
ncbi:MAG: hypothetical protein KIS67_28780 [Verrucomicrobiae bacterium]|nr:hypothetical protein [Verrucomicrobiae bacterium]